MIVKIHSRGAGSGSGPVDYLLGKDRQREQASVLRGNPEHVRELIDGCDFARAYTSGVLSFQEPDIADVEKSRLMDEWEHTLLPGLDRDQYACLWVEHRDKGRLELNFVIPNIELQSGKRLQPYFDRADRPRVQRLADPDQRPAGAARPERPDLSPPADAGQRSAPRQTAGGRENYRRADEPDAAGRDPQPAGRGDAAGKLWPDRGAGNEKQHQHCRSGRRPKYPAERNDL